MAIVLDGTTGITTPALENDGVTTVAAGSASAPAITTDGDTNTGIFFPAADTIAFTEGGVESLRVDSSANLQFNSGYGSVATAYGCRAWVNFNGTTNVGGFCTIRASGNVSSITDNGTGDYTVNFSTAMPDANYGFNATAVINTNAGQAVSAPTTSALRIGLERTDGASIDSAYVCVSIFR